MDQLIKKFEKLPRARLSLQGSLKIRYRLYLAIWRKNSGRFFGSFEPARLVPVTAGILLAVLITAIPAYAYNSPRVNSDNLLYPVKQSIEKIELMAAVSPVAKAKLYTKISERRLEEAKVLSFGQAQQTGDKTEQALQITQTINEALKYNNEALQEAGSISDQDQADFIKGIVKRSREKNIRLMSDIARSVGVRADEKMMDSLAFALNGIDPRPRLPVNGDAATTTSDEASTTQEILTDDKITPHTEKISNLIKQKIEAKTVIKDARQLSVKVKTEISQQAAGKPTTSPLQAIGSERSKNISNTLNAIKKNMNDLKLELKRGEIGLEELQILVGKLNDKIGKIEAAADGGQFEQMDQLLSETQILSNYGGYFISRQKSETNGAEKTNDGSGQNSGQTNPSGNGNGNKK